MNSESGAMRSSLSTSQFPFGCTDVVVDPRSRAFYHLCLRIFFTVLGFVLFFAFDTLLIQKINFCLMFDAGMERNVHRLLLLLLIRVPS